MKLKVNGQERDVDVDPETPLLWVLRDALGLKGTKFGCGAALCGACSVLRDGEVVRSCVMPVRRAEGTEIVTIEGLEEDGKLHPVQEAWVEEQVPQCGYCQPGFIIATVGLLRHVRDPSDEDIDRSITNLCRCGTYERVRRAVHRAAAAMED
ncbi:MAG: (2Fe-2S)-binding protein [Myxococcota bacterium]